MALNVRPTERLSRPAISPLAIAVSTWAILTALWSIFTPPKETYVARVLLFQPLWLLRIQRADSTCVGDMALVLVLHALSSVWFDTWRLPRLDTTAYTDTGLNVIDMYIRLFSLLGACGLGGGAIVYRGCQMMASDERKPKLPLRREEVQKYLIPPLLIGSRTTHSRLFPKKHSFAYSYFLVGVPVGIRGRIGNALSVDSTESGWFAVNASDYLSRANHSKYLHEKLRSYLHSQGVTGLDYSFAYLVTAPRFAGYSFNPVSFWYIYDSGRKLKYMILEVNNTFDERRMYLLKGESVQDREDVPNEITFRQTWSKDFHVSPFNSRKGFYSLRSVDPLATYQESGSVRIDNTIVLRSSKENAKIVARIWSTEEPRDPLQINGLELAQVVTAWWWIGFATFPRIVWQAQKLFFKRKLHVWFRPEVTVTSIGRAYTNDEQSIEAFFLAFLKDAVGRAARPLRIHYRAAHHNGDDVVLSSPGYKSSRDHRRMLLIDVRSPAFYSRFVHYACAKDAFSGEGLATDEKNRTVIIGQPDLLPTLLQAISHTDECPLPIRQRQTSSRIQTARWKLLAMLRCPLPAPSYPHWADRLATTKHQYEWSELDCFVMGSCGDRNVYKRVVSKLFIAQRIAFGLTPVLSILDWLVRASLVCAAMHYCRSTESFDVFRMEKFKGLAAPGVWVILMLANGLHFWAFLKD